MKLLIAATAFLFQLIIQDAKTGETLPGVKIATKSGVYYTDINGKVVLPSNDTVVAINYVSYQDKVIKLKSDTLITLSPKELPWQ